MTQLKPPLLAESGWTSVVAVLKRKTIVPSYLSSSQDSWRMHHWWTTPEEMQRGWGKSSISLIIRAALWTQTPFLCFAGARNHFQGPAKTEFIGNDQEVIKQPKGRDRSQKHTSIWGIFSDPWLFLEVHIAVCNLPHTLVWLLFFSVPVCCHLLLLNRLTKTSWRPCEFWTHLFGNFHWCQMFSSTHVLMYHHLPQSTGSTARTVRFLLIAFEL